MTQLFRPAPRPSHSPWTRWPMAGTLASLLLFLTLSAPGATWTHRDGRTLKADYIRLEGDFVVLRPESNPGKEVRIKITDPSPKDQEFLSDRREYEKQLARENKGPVITLRKGDTRVTFPAVQGPRVHLQPKEAWFFISVKNTAPRRADRFWSNISQEGTIALLDRASGSPEERAFREKDLKRRQYDITQIEDLGNGNRALIYTDVDDKKRLNVRRYILWKIVGDEILKLDFTYADHSSNIQRDEGRQHIIELLQGLELNQAKVPEIAAMLEALASGKYPRALLRR